MTEREALKLALEALEDWHSCFFHEDDAIAITAIKEALREHAMYEVQRLGQEIQPEPPQRTWVGLSVFEINDLVENTDSEDYRNLVERTEAKLKQKNGYDS